MLRTYLVRQWGSILAILRSSCCLALVWLIPPSPHVAPTKSTALIFRNRSFTCLKLRDPIPPPPHLCSLSPPLLSLSKLSHPSLADLKTEVRERFKFSISTPGCYQASSTHPPPLLLQSKSQSRGKAERTQHCSVGGTWGLPTLCRRSAISFYLL